MSQKRARITWKHDCLDKTFLEACLHELTTNGREGGSLKASSWKAVAEKLKNEHDFEVDQKQIRNRYDYLKGKYAVWVRLKNKTGNIYDPLTNSFNMIDEEWEAEAKTSKYVDKLRNAPLLYLDLCTQLFVGAIATGVHSWGPYSTLPHPVEGYFSQDFDDIQCTQMETPATTEPVGASEESSAHSKKKGEKRKGKESAGNKIDSKLVEVGEELIKLARSLVEKNAMVEKKYS